MKLTLYLVILAVMFCIGQTKAFDLSNGYFSLEGKDGIITSMRLDPTGKGNYSRNHIISFRIGDPLADTNQKIEIDPSDHRILLKDTKVSVPTKVEQTESMSPELLQPGHTIGQTFVWEHGFLQSIEACMPAWGTKDSCVTMTLYRIDGDIKTKVASKRLDNIIDNNLRGIKCPDQPAGTYLLELSDVKGMVGWWSQGDNLIKGEAFTDGVANPNMDRRLLCTGYDICVGDQVYALDGNKLLAKFIPRDGVVNPQIQTKITIPWVKSGYDTTSDNIIFHHFLTADGHYMPVHQFKRRPFAGVGDVWVLMSGRFGSDLKFTDAPIHLTMEENSMTLSMPCTERVIELLPHTDTLSEGFPRFYSSDEKIDKVLNEFLLSHNFNFGIGTNSDWKDWHTLQLAWTANQQAELQHGQFFNTKMDPNGYVYSWGGDPGWPFPYEDRDGDGKNDLDSRHFTTNPCYIIGAWREYCWRPDPDYLAKLMPRVRSAMEFLLKECSGAAGIMKIRAQGHEGRDGCFGSSYWDISPFGWKDAFTNAHYYPSLEAMAQLEEAVRRDPAVAEKLKSTIPTAHTPDYYRRLKEVVRKSYNDTFWLADKGRYSGCVDIDGVTHDYGFTYVNLPAMAYGLADADQVKRIYDWMENGITSSGKADTYSRWIFAPRACTIHIPRRSEPQTPVPSWWCRDWGGTDYDDQCQDGGAILYTSYHDIVARAKFLGADNAWARFTTILDRYAEPDHLSGGSPLYRGETTQGGPGGSAGGVGVEGEFPESGLVPVSFLYAFLGIDADINGLKIKPNLPKALRFGGVKDIQYKGLMYDIRVTNDAVQLTCTTKGKERTIRHDLKPGETFVFKG